MKIGGTRQDESAFVRADGIVAAARQGAAIFCEIQLRLSAESRYADEPAVAGDFNGILYFPCFYWE